ncbi:hypothetical protein C8J57DRAFT_1569404 [Mycena rebaudengoi]|nr:hypothetical protein C8J57DRAFT_1569404 [Mycena rebaudengoi]
MAAATCCPCKRAPGLKILELCAKRRFWNTLAESHFSRPKIAELNDGSVSNGLMCPEIRSPNESSLFNAISCLPPNTRTCRLRAVPAAIRTQAGVTNPAVLPTANSPQPGPVDLTAILEGAFSPAALPAHRQFGSIGSQADLTRATKWSPIAIEEALVFWWFCSTDALETESRNRKNISNMRKTQIFGTRLRNRNFPPEVADGSVAVDLPCSEFRSCNEISYLKVISYPPCPARVPAARANAHSQWSSGTKTGVTNRDQRNADGRHILPSPAHSKMMCPGLAVPA